MHRVLLERRIRDVHTRLVRAREELAVLNEQLAVVQESADEARVRALVSETPLASQEHNEAARHADAMVRARDALGKVVSDLERRHTCGAKSSDFELSGILVDSAGPGIAEMAGSAASGFSRVTRYLRSVGQKHLGADSRATFSHSPPVPALPVNCRNVHV